MNIYLFRMKAPFHHRHMQTTILSWIPFSICNWKHIDQLSCAWRSDLGYLNRDHCIDGSCCKTHEPFIRGKLNEPLTAF